MNYTLLICFFVSGATGLVYEVLWARYLSLFLGNTTYSHMIVLATFMAGLSIGNLLFGRIADRVASRVRIYAWLELGIGLACLLYPQAIKFLGQAYLDYSRPLGPDHILVGVLRLPLAALTLVIPTVLMGGTLPMLSRYFVQRVDTTRQWIGRLYFLNSMGAVFGTLFAGFFMIPEFGMDFSMVIGAAGNIVVGIVALYLKRYESESPPLSQSPQNDYARNDGKGSNIGQPLQKSRLNILLILIGISGAASFIYEMAWIRFFGLVLGSSTYSFSLMLAAFITGITLGSLAVSTDRFPIRRPVFLFAVAELLACAFLALSIPFYDRLPYYFMRLAGLFVRNTSTYPLYHLLKFGVCFSLMFVPTFFLGTTLPLVSSAVTEELRILGRRVGTVFSVNTLGTILGALLAGLALLPLLGMKGTLDAGIATNLLVFLAAMIISPGIRSSLKTVYTVIPLFIIIPVMVISPEWNKRSLSAGVFRRPISVAGRGYKGFLEMLEARKLLYYRDGLNTTVTVEESQGGERILKVNGKPDASIRGDLPTQLLCAHLPLLLKPSTSKNVMVIGFGSGITAGSVLQYPDINLDLVEISPAVMEAGGYFKEHNYDVKNNPRFHAHITDAKTFMALTPKKYDIIISEPSNLWIAGIGGLFSREFFSNARERLKDDGIMVQWFHAYEMTDDISKTIVNTFNYTFPYVTLWNTLGQDIQMIGSKGAFRLDFNEMRRRMGIQGIKEDLERLGISHPYTLLNLQILSTESVVEFVSGKCLLNSDYFPIIEFRAPLAFFLRRPTNVLIGYDERLKWEKETNLFVDDFLKGRDPSSDELKELATYLNKYRGINPNLFPSVLKTAMKLYPDESDWARISRAKLCIGRGRPHCALAMTGELLNLPDPPLEALWLNAQARNMVLRETSSTLNPPKLDDIRALLKRSIDIDPEKESLYRFRLGSIYVTWKMHEDALKELKSSLELWSEDMKDELDKDNILTATAGVYIKLKRKDEARLTLKDALKYNPDNLPSKRMLERLNQENDE